MKTERRHELQANQLAEFLTDVSEKAKPYAKGLLGVALAALVVVCAYLYLSKRAEAEEGVSWDLAWQAIADRSEDGLREVIKTYPNKPAAIWSQLVLADIELSRGVNGLFAQKSAGRELVTSALDDYRYVADHATQPLLREQALFGMGRAQESLNQLDKAREAYELVVKNFPSGPYAKRAQQRLDELARDSTKVFYDWFATAEPATSIFRKGGSFINPFDEPGSSEKNLPPFPPGFVLPDIDKSKTPPPEPKADESKAKPGDAKPADGKSGDNKTGEAKAGDAKTGDVKSAEPKADPGKAASDPKATGESKAPSAKPDDAKSSAPKVESPKPAAPSAAPSTTPEKSGSAK